MTERKRRPILQWILSGLCILLLAAPLLAAGRLFSVTLKLHSYPQDIPKLSRSLQGLMITAGDGADFPDKASNSIRSKQTLLNRIAQFAAANGYNAIFFETLKAGEAFYRSDLLPASPEGKTVESRFLPFDPLDYLTDICRENGIQVYAVLNTGAAADTPPASPSGAAHPLEKSTEPIVAQAAAELSKHYSISGILLRAPENAVDDFTQTVQATADAMKIRKHQKLGIIADINMLSDHTLQPETFSTADFVVTTGSPAPEKESTAFAEQLNAWSTFCSNNQLAHYPMHTWEANASIQNAIENAVWLERKVDVDGIVIQANGLFHPENQLPAVSLRASLLQQEEPNMPDLTFAQTFAVTRPTQTLHLDASWKSYFVTGTAVPGIPVTCNGNPIETTSKGLWGYAIPLVYGTNEVSFAQNGIVNTVTIVRNEPVNTVISAIVADSAYPTANEVVLPGARLQLSCKAPVGSTVTATVGGLSATLQETASAQGGASVYAAQLDVSSLAVSDKLQNIGKVTYRHNGTGQSTQQSQGDVLVTGANAVPVAKTQQFGTMVNQNAANDGAYFTILRQNCVDKIVANEGNYYRLSIGGYLPKSAVSIESGAQAVMSKVSGVTLEKTSKGEKLVLALSNRPAYKGTLTPQSLTVTLSNLTGWDSRFLDAITGDLFQSVSADQGNDDSVTLTFHLAESANLAGWDVLFDEDNRMSIYLRQKPTIDWQSGAPLSNVTIALDPGHGGNDPGAIGIPGASGPVESILNLADAYALRSRLTALGADVRILQENTTSAMDTRLQQAQQLDADLFISSHHNSLSEATDATNVSGVEVYYWNDASGEFAQNIAKNLSQETGRPLRSVTQSWYRVTMMYACPAVLVESGFINSPKEYEALSNEFAMYQYANALTDAVLQYLS